jgi:hypothetical protein
MDCHKFWHANSLIQQIFKPTRQGFQFDESNCSWASTKLCVIILHAHTWSEFANCQWRSGRRRNEWFITPNTLKWTQQNFHAFWAALGARAFVYIIDYIPLSAARNRRSGECVWSGFQRVGEASIYLAEGLEIGSVICLYLAVPCDNLRQHPRLTLSVRSRAKMYTIRVK